MKTSIHLSTEFIDLFKVKNSLRRKCVLTIILLALPFFAPYFLHAQCTTLTDAVPGVILTPCSGTLNRSGVAYNPNFNIYYSVNAGSETYNIQTYSSSGTLLDTRQQGFDYRGLWWNPNRNILEGNGYYGLGISMQKLNNTNGYPLGTVKVLFPGNQPNAQSCGAYDYDLNNILYYYNGKVYNFSGKDYVFRGSKRLNSIPVPLSAINITSIIYTGCAGKEIGIYDFINKRVYLFDKATGDFSASIQLPLSAPSPQLYRMGYANNLFWLFNDTDTWFSYNLFAPAAAISNTSVSSSATADKKINISISISPNPVKNILNIQLQNMEDAKGSLQVTGITGKMMISKPVAFQKGINNIFLDVDLLNPGMYFLKVISNTKIETVKFMKE